jgi:hypothetical protein
MDLSTGWKIADGNQIFIIVETSIKKMISGVPKKLDSILYIELEKINLVQFYIEFESDCNNK